MRRFPTPALPMNRRFVVLSLVVLLSACRDRTPPRTIGAAEATNMIGGTALFARELTVRVPRAIAVEPKFGTAMAPRFASSLGVEGLKDDEIFTVDPAVALLWSAQHVTIEDSPISEHYAGGRVDISHRSARNRVEAALHQRANRYWRHYLKVQPVRAEVEDWKTEYGPDEIDERHASARISRTPGWKAVVARPEVVSIDSIAEQPDTVDVRFRWRWKPTPLGEPFAAPDSLVPAVAAGRDTVRAPVLLEREYPGRARFAKTAIGWTHIP